jgi:RNA polymerase sigma-70 factor (ECF subfamily)
MMKPLSVRNHTAPKAGSGADFGEELAGFPRNRGGSWIVCSVEKRSPVTGSGTKAEAAAERDRCADPLERAFVDYQGELLGMLYHLVGNLQDAQDALQESFVKCWRNRDKIDELQNLKAWVFRVALNTGRDLRQTAWRRRRQALPDDPSSVVSRQRAPEEEVEANEQIAQLREAVSQLRLEEQEVFLLRQNAEMTYEEISEALNVPTGTVKTRMRLALGRLRTAMASGR